VTHSRAAYITSEASLGGPHLALSRPPQQTRQYIQTIRHKQRSHYIRNSHRTERDRGSRQPEVGDDELAAFLEAHLFDMGEEEWLNICKCFIAILTGYVFTLFYVDSRVLLKRDSKTLELLATHLRTHFLRTTWDDLCLGICAERDIPSEFIAWQRLRILANLDTRLYGCCINSCCVFLGKHTTLGIHILNHRTNLCDCFFFRTIHGPQ
jgi:hypothetical protein